MRSFILILLIQIKRAFLFERLLILHSQQIISYCTNVRKLSIVNVTAKTVPSVYVNTALLNEENNIFSFTTLDIALNAIASPVTNETITKMINDNVFIKFLSLFNYI